MSDPLSNLNRLEQAGILDPSQFSPEELAQVATLTDLEVDALIQLRKRLGEPAPGKEYMKPNIIV